MLKDLKITMLILIAFPLFFIGKGIDTFCNYVDRKVEEDRRASGN